MAPPPQLRSEGGFTLMELLVVILIVGILAAIGIPALLNQKAKANDASAKVQVRTAETAAEAYSTDHGGVYTGLEIKQLLKLEPALLQIAPSKLTVGTVAANSYEVSSEILASGEKFTVKRLANAQIERTCEPGGTGACPPGGKW